MRRTIFLLGVFVLILIEARDLLAQRQQAPIIAAAAAGDAKKVGELLAADPALINATATFREMPLHMAVKGSHRAVVELLLDKGAKINEPSMTHGTPLALAAKKGNLEIVELLVLRGAYANPSADDREGSPLSIAASAGNKPIVEFLLKNGAVVNARGWRVSTPLIGAVENGHAEIAKLLFEHGADVNVRDPYTGSAFEMALRTGNLELARSFVPRLADPAKSLGSPPLTAAQLTDAKLVEERLNLMATAYREFHAACSAGKLPQVKEALQLWPELANAPPKRYGNKPLLLAVESGNPELVELLVAAGAEIEHESSDGTALDRAIKLGRLEVVKALVGKGARLNAERVGARNVPLCLAVSVGDKPIVEYLLQQGAAINAVAWPGETPLNIAAQRGNLELARLLLDRGANLKGGDRGSPLATAAALGNVEMVELLLDRGAENNAAVMQAASRAKKQNIVDLLTRRGGRVDIVTLVSLGDTTQVAEMLKSDPKLMRAVTTTGSLLHLAVSLEDEGMAQLLLSHGANVNARNGQRRTALHLAAEKGHVDMVSMLLKHKADVNLRDNEGQTAWDVVRGNQIVKEILEDNGGKSGRLVGEGETVTGATRRAKALTGPTIVFGQWTMYPGGQFRFTSDQFRLLIRNDDGKMFRECEVGPATDFFRVTSDPKAGTAIVLMEKIEGKEKTTQFKDEQDFKKQAPERAKRLDELLESQEQKRLDGNWEFRGPGSTKRIGGDALDQE